MEFTQYRNKFFPIGESTDQQKVNFAVAWKHHYINNHHHWETAIEKIDIVHMVIDWTAMSYKFGDTAEEYYTANKDKIVLSAYLTEFMHTIFKCLKDNQ